jgi:adenylosuccinate lyase
MALVAAGAGRQEAHEWIREASLQAWQALQEGIEANPLPALLAGDERIRRYLEATQVETLMDVTSHVGTAPQRALALAVAIRTEIDKGD